MSWVKMSSKSQSVAVQETGAFSGPRLSHRLVLAGLVLLVAVFAALPALAAPHAAGPTPARTAPAPSLLVGPGDPAEMEAFVDAFFESRMAALHIPGAAIVVVHDGKVVLSKGYGYADVARRTPVDPNKTAFRAGSVSKLFTWTAVMQLVERGLLDLDGDVNQYLTDFQIPNTYPEPITLAHLLTHTAGFEDRWIATATRDPEELEPLGHALKVSIPRRVLPPGQIHSYSNYGTALAGHLVEKVSGLSFEDYVLANILRPLGMDGTTFLQPLPRAIEANVATGYTYADGTLEPAPLIYQNMSPEGGLTVTPIDMAAFMNAHLHEGAVGGVRVLEAATAHTMHEQQFTHHPELPGMTYGFKERIINGRRAIGHGGDIHTFASQMILVPDDDLGFFVVYNRFDDAFREEFIAAFFDHYYPAQVEAPAPQAITSSPADLDRFAGTYRWVRHPRSTIGKLIALIPGPHWVVVKANEDASLALSFFGAGVSWRYAPVGQNVFVQVEGGLQSLGGLLIDPGDMLAFRENQAGEVTFGFISLQNTAFEKLAWYELPEVQLGTMGSLLLLYFSAVVLWPLGAVIGRLRKRAPGPVLAWRRAVWVGWIVSALNLTFLLVLLLSFGEALVFGVPLLIRVILLIPILTCILTVVMVIQSLVGWLRGHASFGGRLYYTLIALASVLFILFAGYWNMLGWRF